MTLLGARRRPPPEEYWSAARGRCQPRPAGLRLGGDWRKKLAENENAREPDQPHGHLGGDGWRESSRTSCVAEIAAAYLSVHKSSSSISQALRQLGRRGNRMTSL